MNVTLDQRESNKLIFFDKNDAFYVYILLTVPKHY